MCNFLCALHFCTIFFVVSAVPIFIILGEHVLERPIALAVRLPGAGAHFRTGVMKFKSTKSDHDAEPVIRSSFPESWIFEDFHE